MNEERLPLDEQMRRLSGCNADLTAERHEIDGKKIEIYYQQAMVDKLLLRRAAECLVSSCAEGRQQLDGFQTATGASSVPTDPTAAELSRLLFSGQTLFYLPWVPAAYAVGTANPPQRSPEDSSLDPAIRGARDGFVEELETNVALLRKRLPMDRLRVEYFAMGETGNRIALVYVADRLREETLRLVRTKLEDLRHTTIEGGSARFEDLLFGRSYSIFPLADTTGRSDFATEKLLRGRFALLMDGTPTATIGPITLTELAISPEDAYYPYFVATAGRWTRYVGYWLSILLPGFYDGLLMYHQEQIPFRLLATIGLARTGIPIPAVIEMLIVLFLLDLLREAGSRLPQAVGNTITVVGGIIIGQAALQSGVLTPSMMVIASLSFVAGSTLVNPSLQGTVRIARLFVLLMSSLAGMIGFMAGLLLFLVYQMRLDSFGELYAGSVADSRFKVNLGVFWRAPFRRTGLASRQGQGEDDV
ncbi:spore germination protein [Cohnella sp. JJ-181]|uniref:spore germination protein n=1 Tax=Cohnella rhizoplanae TaxID=2974897 RepID=UPI0022FF6B7F|nr:spore germination protein [Cohnella sp. JJ-181]CAI6033749.1 Spore germination protein XA [Cohnella sp. JJ-181]